MSPVKIFGTRLNAVHYLNLLAIDNLEVAMVMVHNKRGYTYRQWMVRLKDTELYLREDGSIG